MDRRGVLRAAVLLLITPGLSACTATTTGDSMTSTIPSPDPTAERAQGVRALLVYFSRPGENYSHSGRTDLTIGNTEVVANMIAAAVAVDAYRIEAADPYPDDYEQTVARNVREEDQDARPAIANPLPDASAYDAILLGCPVWNVQAPMIMRTFIESVDLVGKTVHPFVTYAASGMGRVRRDYAELLPDTTVTDGLAVRGEEAQRARGDVERWLGQIGLLRA